MNSNERKMLDILIRGKEKYGFVGVKAEFEAEGTRTDELLRLVEICRRANLKLALKIGGCEALRDLMEAKQIGVDYIVAPMVETPYALSKFIDAKNTIYSKTDQEDCDFLFNLESITAFNQVDDMLKMAEGRVNGVVFGRVDFTLSMGLTRQEINFSPTTDHVLTTSKKCKARKLDLVVGGGIALEAMPVMKRIQAEYLNRFETRKILFDAAICTSNEVERGLSQAVEFELLWLINKREYYKTIFGEDEKRIDMLQRRAEAAKAA